MKITNEAKKMLEEVFVTNDCDCLKVMLQESCCGTSLVFNVSKMADGDEPRSINDVPVLMGADVEERAQTVTIAVKNGDLAIQDSVESGCC